jgi:tetratricopeptide (TPR) repeat protein
VDAASRFSRRLEAVWVVAGRPSADEIALLAQEKLDVDISSSTIRGWLRHGRLPRSDETFLAVLRLLRVERPAELMSLLKDARQPEVAQRNSERESPAREPALRPAPRPIPRQLPAVLGDFIGRKDALAVLGGALTGTGAGISRHMAVFSIAGAAGIGKTSLALWWAHGNLGEFPGGQLYVDLRGFGPSGSPMAPSVAVCGFLTALGVSAADIPADVDGQAALYRSLLSGRRMLVVLDNARDISQVLPLLPGSPTCTVLVTSRIRLTGLQVRGARLIELDTLPEEEARALLVARIGAEAASSQTDSVTALVRSCAGLPLALAIVAARATAQQALPLAFLAEELAAETHRLDALDAGDVGSSARAVLSWSYRALPLEAARAFRLLGLATGPDIGLDACAALLGTQQAVARALIDVLVAAHLVQEHRRNRYRMHDLLRIFSSECLRDDESPVDREQAVSRLVDWFAHAADAASRVIAPLRRRVLSPAAGEDPAFGTYDAALEWFSVEHRNVAAAVELAAEWRSYDLSWKLAIIMFSYYNLNKGWREYLTSLATALEAACSAGSEYGRAWVLNAMGSAYGSLEYYEEGTSYLEQSLTLWRAVDDRQGVSMTLNNLGETYRRAGSYRRAIEYYEMDRQFCRANGDEDGESVRLNNLGKAWLALGNTAQAIRSQRLALEIRRRVKDLHEEAEILNDLGEVYRRCQQYSRSSQSYQLALAAYRRAGDALGAAQVVVSLSELAHERGELPEARQLAREALTISATVDEDDAPSLRRQIDTLQRQLAAADANVPMPDRQ